MFLTVGDAPHLNDYPVHSAIGESDWHILAGFWHPVAFAHAVTDQPVAAQLLDVALVIFRTSVGVSVARDRCPHRGVRVSGGRIHADQLICPMHGLHFDGGGKCRKIPSRPDQSAPISSRMRLQTYSAEERYGIIWVCMKETPIWPLPTWAGIGDPDLKKVFVPPATWRASAPRHVENFNDLAHFPWVHLASFGSDNDSAVDDYEVIDTSDGLRFATPYREGGNRFPDGVEAADRDVIYTYEFTFPFTTLLTVDPQGSDFVHYFADAACPVSAGETRIFQVLTDTTGNPDPDFWVADSVTINADDQPLVEGQPDGFPLEGGSELHHLPADRWSIRYRQLLREKFDLGKR